MRRASKEKHEKVENSGGLSRSEYEWDEAIEGVRLWASKTKTKFFRHEFHFFSGNKIKWWRTIRCHRSSTSGICASPRLTPFCFFFVFLEDLCPTTFLDKFWHDLRTRRCRFQRSSQIDWNFVIINIIILKRPSWPEVKSIEVSLSGLSVSCQGRQCLCLMTCPRPWQILKSIFKRFYDLDDTDLVPFIKSELRKTCSSLFLYMLYCIITTSHKYKLFYSTLH